MTYKKIIGLFASIALASAVHATVVLKENFTYTNGSLTAVSGGSWFAVSGGGSLPVTVKNSVITFTNVGAGTSGEDLARNFGTSVSSGNLYMSAMVMLSNAVTTASGDYFLALYSTNTSGGGYITRIFASSLTGGGWSFGMTNASGTGPIDWGTALTTNTFYKLIVKLDAGSGRTASFGVFPANYTPTDDSELTVSSPASSATAPVTSVAIRQGGNSSPFNGAINYILVGDTLADVAGDNIVPPAITYQPQDAAGFVGSTASFNTVAVGETGDAPLTYKWYYNNGTVPLTESATHFIGTTSNVLVITNLVLGDAGTYSCVVTNAGGTNVTRFANLLVSLAPVPPIIDTNLSTTPLTYYIGDNLTLSVGAHGLPIPAYTWKFVPATNTAVTNIVVGGTVSADAFGSTLTLPLTSTNQSGQYFVTVTNSTSYFTTNSLKAPITVNASPFLTIAEVRAKVNGSYAPTNTTAIYTVQGTVTTWTNMTTSTNSCLFYIQDNTGGIAVFWTAAFPTNLPPAGAVVRVSGPMTSFNGLLELGPVYTNALTSVSIISTGGPLPKPQPLPMDPFVTGDLAKMKAMESCYFVVSNVFLKSEATFVSGSNEGMTNASTNPKYLAFTNSLYSGGNAILYTNLNGQTFTFFVNAATDIRGKAKPSGPVTIYGVLGYFTTVGYEFTPSRYADIISYVFTTNVVSNARKGDLPTNNYTENVLRAGEQMTSYFNIADADGGSVTLTPITDGLSGNSSWSTPVNGMAAKITFTFNPSVADAGSNYLVKLGVTSTAGTSYTNQFAVYVPTTNEQQIAIAEFLANPATSASFPNFNPLQRPTDTINVAANDQYIEIANLSQFDLGPGGWTVDKGTASSPVFDANAGAGATVGTAGSLVIYSGNATEAPGISPVAMSGSGLALPSSGNGQIVLRNANGNIIDRVVYSSANLATNSSLSRFPTINSAFVRQAYISTNYVSPNAQYNGSAWSAPTATPQGVNNLAISATNNAAYIKFTADTTKASTLWSADDLTSPFTVLTGQQFGSSAATFVDTNLQPKRFYYISTQQ